MILVFKKKQKVKYQLHALQSLKNRLDYKLHLLADYLSKKSDHISPRKLALCIIAFCVLTSIGLTYIAMTSVKYKSAIEVQSIRTPAIKQVEIPKANELLLKRIIRFHKYLDSLKEYDADHYQAITTRRPHLVDSLNEAEQILHLKN